MDGPRFDALTRTLSTAPSRRRVLGVLVGALAGDTLGLHRLEAMAAGCPGLGNQGKCLSDGECAACGDAVCQRATCLRPPGGKCKKSRQCTSGSCNRKKHKCRPCPEGQRACGGTCISDCDGNTTDWFNCLCCYADTCDATALCCAGHIPASCVGGHCTGCKTENEECDVNSECCTNVCGIGGKCTCTNFGGGCVRHAQCCSRHCGADGRCADPCGNGELPCNDVCCPATATCVSGDCLCADNREPCGGTRCCAADETCGLAGCVGGVGGGGG